MRTVFIIIIHLIINMVGHWFISTHVLVYILLININHHHHFHHHQALSPVFLLLSFNKSSSSIIIIIIIIKSPSDDYNQTSSPFIVCYWCLVMFNMHKNHRLYFTLVYKSYICFSLFQFYQRVAYFLTELGNYSVPFVIFLIYRINLHVHGRCTKKARIYMVFFLPCHVVYHNDF